MTRARRWRGWLFIAAIGFMWTGTIRTGAAEGPASQAAEPLDPSRANMPLAQIQPAVEPPQPLSAAASQPDVSSAARRALRRGQDRFDEELWGEAINEVARAVQAAPHYDEARLLLARAAALQGNLPLALTNLTALLERRPSDVAVHQMLADVHWQMHDAARAIEHARLALLCPDATAERPETALAHLILGLALQSEGYLSAAVEQYGLFLDACDKPSPAARRQVEFRQAVALYRSRCALASAELLDKLGRVDAAVDATRRAAERAPADPVVQGDLARRMARAGKHGEALEIAQAMCLSENAGAGLTLLRELLADHPSTDEAVRVLLAVGRASKRPAVITAVAAELESRGQPDGALELLTAAIDGGVESVESRMKAAALAAALSRWDVAARHWLHVVREGEDAVAQVEQALEAAASEESRRGPLLAAIESLAHEEGEAGAQGKFLLGRLLISAGREDEAAVALSEAIAANPRLGPAYVALADLKVRRGMWQAAIESCEAALSAGVREAAVYRLKARAHEGLDDLDGAVGAYQEAIKINGKDAASMLALAKLLDGRNEATQAVSVLNRIVQEVDPGHAEARELLIRACLALQNHRRAKEHLEQLRGHGAPEHVLARIEAMVVFATDGSMSGLERLERYRKTLSALQARFPDDLETGMDLALSLFATRDYAASTEALSRVLERHPQSPRALELHAELLAKDLRFEEAKAVWRELLRQRSRHAEWHEQLAEACLDAGDFAGAADAYRTLTTLPTAQARQGEFHARRLQALLDLKDQSGAVAAAVEWLSVAAEDENARLGYLMALRAAGRGDEAVRKAAEWCERRPNDLAVRVLYLRELQNAGRHAEVLRLILEAMRRAADATDADERWADQLWRALSKAGDHDGAIEVVRTFLESGEPSEADERALVAVLQAARRYDEALAVLRAGNGPAGTDELLTWQLLVAARRYREAEELLVRVIAPLEERRAAGTLKDEDGSELLRFMQRNLATVYQLSGRMDKCRELLETVHAAHPRAADINNDLGYIWADQGVNLPQAEKMIRLALADNPRNEAYLDSLGWVMYKQGRFEQALPYLQRSVATEESPDPVVCDHLGDVLARLGRVDEAVAFWQKVVDVVAAEDRVSTPDDEALAEACRAKLAAVREGRTPPTAAVGESTTRPAAP